MPGCTAQSRDPQSFRNRTGSIRWRRRCPDDGTRLEIDDGQRHARRPGRNPPPPAHGRRCLMEGLWRRPWSARPGSGGPSGRWRRPAGAGGRADRREASRSLRRGKSGMVSGRPNLARIRPEPMPMAFGQGFQAFGQERPRASGASRKPGPFPGPFGCARRIGARSLRPVAVPIPPGGSLRKPPRAADGLPPMSLRA